VTVAVRAQRPLMDDANKLEPFFNELAERSGGRGGVTTAVAARMRAALLDLGYDSLIIRDAGGDGVDYVIALHRSQVKVVRP